MVNVDRARAGLCGPNIGSGWAGLGRARPGHVLRRQAAMWRKRAATRLSGLGHGSGWAGLGKAGPDMCQMCRRRRGISGLLLGSIHRAGPLWTAPCRSMDRRHGPWWTAYTSSSPLSGSGCARCTRVRAKGHDCSLSHSDALTGGELGCSHAMVAQRGC